MVRMTLFSVNGQKKTNRGYDRISDAMPYLRRKAKEGFRPYFVGTDYSDGYGNPRVLVTLMRCDNIMTPGYQSYRTDRNWGHVCEFTRGGHTIKVYGDKV